MPTYTAPVDRLLTLGKPDLTDDWSEYSGLGITSEHVPELIRMMTDTRAFLADKVPDEGWAPIHAWRALGELHATEAVGPYLDLMAKLDEADADEWVREEARDFFPRIGPVALPALAAFLADKQYGLYSRWGVASALTKMAEQYPDSRPEVLAILTRQLEQAAENDPTLNGGLIAELLDMEAVEAAPVIERAFATGNVDEGIAGDLEEVQYELGLRSEPPRSRQSTWQPALPLRDLPLATPSGRTPPARAKERAKARRKVAKQARKKNRKKKR